MRSSKCEENDGTITGTDPQVLVLELMSLWTGLVIMGSSFRRGLSIYHGLGMAVALLVNPHLPILPSIQDSRCC